MTNKVIIIILLVSAFLLVGCEQTQFENTDPAKQEARCISGDYQKERDSLFF